MIAYSRRTLPQAGSEQGAPCALSGEGSDGVGVQGCLEGHTGLPKELLQLPGQPFFLEEECLHR